MKLPPCGVRCAWIVALLFGVACGDDDGGPIDSAVPDAGADTFAPPDVPVIPACGTASGTIPVGATVLSHFDGTSERTDIETLDYTITVNGTDYTLAEGVLYEQTRFDIDRPARIVGYSVQWVLPEGLEPETELEANLYPDFGHNGFDMWRWDPHFVGTRCVRDIGEDGWVDYVLDEPIVMDNPGLVFVASRHEGYDAPRIRMDTSMEQPEGSCAVFEDCRTSFNLPNAEPRVFYNGVTLQHPFDYLVRLHVEYTDEIADEDRVFQPTDLTLGARVAWGDFDDDGWDDVVTDGPRLMRNLGDGTFEDVTTAAGIDPSMGLSGVWGDYDNDGCLDLFVFSNDYTDTDTLLHNQCDGSFVDVTASAGITDTQDYEDCGREGGTGSPSPGAAWFDFDADGFLDLYVSNFICWDRETYYVDAVFRNEGDGTFSDVSETLGFSSDRMASRGAAPIDHDRDGDIDVMVNTYRLQRNRFFDNQGGTFVESGESKNLAGVPNRGGTAYGHTIGAAWGDLDNDGDYDAVHANLAHPRFYNFSDRTQVLIQGPEGFVDNAGSWEFPAGDNGLRFQETHSTPVLADFDNDGNLDLVITCVYDGRPTDYYHGNGDGTFRLDTFTTGITATDIIGASASDYDNDGDTDIVVRELYENTGGDGHWLQVRVIGDVAVNRAAIGATVAVTSAGMTRIRHVNGGTGQGCQDSLFLHFGLGTAESVDAIHIEFPGGATVDYAGPFDADQRIWLMESGATHLGWTPPS